MSFDSLQLGYFISAIGLGAIVSGLIFSWLRNRELSAASTRMLDQKTALEVTSAELAGATASLKALHDSREESRAQVHELQTLVTALRTENADYRVEIENLRTRLDAERKAHGEKLEELSNVRGQIEKDMQVLMNGLLDSSAKSFLERANEVFMQHQEKGHSGMQSMVSPLKDSLEQFKKQITDMETRRKHDEGQLIQQIRHISESHGKLNDTTVSLVNALRSAPKTRGRWGEQQLRTLLELAGMSEYVDFETEKHFATEEGAKRPDAILRMPGGRVLVVDAKTSLSAYLAAMEADHDEEREVQLGNHARQIRAHVDQLGRKEYWKALPQDTVDFVVMFVPGEPMYAAAMARDPGLFEHAWDKKVIICSPTTLLGLAKAIAYGWRQERASRDARKVQEVATELYRRMVKLGNDVSGMTKSLESHVKKHNQFIGSLEGSVLPHARKMTDLSIGSEQEEIKELDPVESDVREPKEGRDMVFEDPRSLPNPSEIS